MAQHKAHLRSGGGGLRLRILLASSLGFSRCGGGFALGVLLSGFSLLGESSGGLLLSKVALGFLGVGSDQLGLGLVGNRGGLGFSCGDFGGGVLGVGLGFGGRGLLLFGGSCEGGMRVSEPSLL